jgi:hypothetical protein
MASYFSAARFLPSRFSILRRSETIKIRARIVFAAGFEFLFETLQPHFFFHCRHSRLLCCQIDAPDGGVDDVRNLVGKAARTPIRALLSEQDGYASGSIVIFYQSIDSDRMSAQDAGCPINGTAIEGVTRLATQAVRDSSICLDARHRWAYWRRKDRANSFANFESSSDLRITQVSKHKEVSDSGLTTIPSAP